MQRIHDPPVHVHRPAGQRESQFPVTQTPGSQRCGDEPRCDSLGRACCPAFDALLEKGIGLLRGSLSTSVSASELRAITIAPGAPGSSGGTDRALPLWRSASLIA